MVDYMSLKLRENIGLERDLGITHISVKIRLDTTTQRESECRQSILECQGEGRLGKGWEGAHNQWRQDRWG